MKNRYENPIIHGVRNILLVLLPTFAISSASAQDCYAGLRQGWLEKAHANKPELRQTTHQPVAIIEVDEDETAFQNLRARRLSDASPLYTQSLAANSGVIVDFGDHMTGYVSFSLKSLNRTPDAPVRLKFTFGESLGEVAAPLDPYTGALSRAWLQDETVTVVFMPEEITIPRRVAFRYVRIDVAAAPNYEFCFENLVCRASTSASAEPEPLPANVSEEIREIDRIGLNTLRECMQTVFEDGPKRDRRLWIGDLYLQALANNASFDQQDLTRRCLYLLAAVSAEDGRLHGTLLENPFPHPQQGQFLLDYSLLYNVTLLDYLNATGDTRTALDLWPVALRQLDNVLPYLQEDGLLDFEKANSEWWVFFDWREGLHREVALHGLTAFALEKTYELASALGIADEVKEIPALVRGMREAGRKHYYDRRSGMFVGKLDPQVSYISQIWAVLGGLANRDQARKALLNAAEYDGAVRPGTPYAYHYYIQALLDSGLEQEAYDTLRDYWGGMVRKGADTFWEAYDPADDFLSPYHFVQMNSYCHAWSCTPVYFIRNYPRIFQR